MANENKLRVLLIDDHALVREGLKRLINDQPDMEVVADAGEGHMGVRLAQDLAPDIALVDVSMPGLDGDSGDADDRHYMSAGAPDHGESP